MEEEKPWVLISEVGGDHGYLEELADIVKQHFRIICHKELLENPELHGPKIQALLNWKYCPVVEPTLLRLLPALKVVASGGVGVDHLDVPFINSLGVKVTNTPRVVSDSTADLAMGLLLASARRILEDDPTFTLMCDPSNDRGGQDFMSATDTREDKKYCKKVLWGPGHQVAIDPKTVHIPQRLMGVQVTNATLGIIGMGEIGYKIAQRAKGFDMKIVYHNRRRRSAEDERAVGATFCQSLDELLGTSDFVMIAVKFTPETRGLIGHRELSIMKPTATLINISRGQVVDQDALVEALQSGSIQAAALDVTHPEPLPRDHPLLGLHNVLITPHIGINTFTTARQMVEKMVRNAVAAVEGSTVPDEVKLQ